MPVSYMSQLSNKPSLGAWHCLLNIKKGNAMIYKGMPCNPLTKMAR